MDKSIYAKTYGPPKGGENAQGPAFNELRALIDQLHKYKSVIVKKGPSTNFVPGPIFSGAGPVYILRKNILTIKRNRYSYKKYIKNFIQFLIFCYLLFI